MTTSDSKHAWTQERLRHQADRLLHLHGQGPPTPFLLAEHGRRSARRKAMRAACCTAALVIAVAVAGAVRGLWPGSPRVDQSSPRDIAESAVQGLHTSRQKTQWPAGQENAGAERPLGFPVFFAVPDGDRRRVIAAGIYVPEHVEQVNLSEFDPAEQHAIREVLGLQKEETLQESI